MFMSASLLTTPLDWPHCDFAMLLFIAHSIDFPSLFSSRITKLTAVDLLFPSDLQWRDARLVENQSWNLRLLLMFPYAISNSELLMWFLESTFFSFIFWQNKCRISVERSGMLKYFWVSLPVVLLLYKFDNAATAPQVGSRENRAGRAIFQGFLQTTHFLIK